MDHKRSQLNKILQHTSRNELPNDVTRTGLVDNVQAGTDQPRNDNTMAIHNGATTTGEHTEMGP